MSAPVDPSAVPEPGPSSSASSPGPGPAPAPAEWWRRRWLIGGVIAWAVLLLVTSVVSERRDPATVPEQRDAAAAATAVDRATGALLAAVGAAVGPDRVFALGPLVVERNCDITPVRPGATTSRDVTVHTAAGQAPATLDAIGAALPADYRAEVTHRKAGTVHLLRADAGDFIEVRGTVSDGVITLRALSGCRPLAERHQAVSPGRAHHGSQ